MLRAIAEFESASAVLIGWPLALPPSLLQRFAEHVNVVVVLDEAELPAARAHLSATCVRGELPGSRVSRPPRQPLEPRRRRRDALPSVAAAATAVRLRQPRRRCPRRGRRAVPRSRPTRRRTRRPSPSTRRRYHTRRLSACRRARRRRGVRPTRCTAAPPRSRPPRPRRSRCDAHEAAPARRSR